MSIAPANSLKLEQMFIPLTVVPQAYDKISPKILQATEGSESYTLWDFLATSVSEPAYRRIAVIAPPGAGKTVLLEHLMLTYAKNQRRRQHRRAPQLIPILLSLRQVRDRVVRTSPDLAELIEQQPDIQRLNPPPDWFKDQLKKGQTLVLLDGLDEVPDENQRQSVSHWVNEQIQAYRRARFIITSRPLSYETAPVSQIETHLNIKSFGIEQIGIFAKNWYKQNAIARDPNRPKRLDRASRRKAEGKQRDLVRRIRQDQALADLALNPLLLSMILTIDDYGEKQLPLHRVDLYGEIYHVLIEKRQHDRGILDTQIAVKTRQVLQQLALFMMQENLTEITLSGPQAQIPQAIHGALGEDTTLDQLLQKTDSASGLLVKTAENTLTLAHESFRYYLAALQIQETTPTEQATHPKILIDNVNNAWWTETILLYGAMVRDGSDIATAALNEGDRVSLALANAMVQDNVPVSEAVHQQLLECLDQDLTSANAGVANLAAQVKLTNRLRELRPADTSTEIDASYISVAEYQLFLLAQDSGAHSPEHLQLDQVSNLELQKPITGIRPEDARAYCDWLNAAYPSDSAAVKFYYRLPRPSELNAQPLQQTNQPVGTWCAQGDSYAFRGISRHWHEQWERKLLSLVEAAIPRDRQRAQQIVAVLKQDLPDMVGLDGDAFRLPLGTHLADAAGQVANVGLDQALKLVESPIFAEAAQLHFLMRAAQIIRNQLPATRQLLERNLPYSDRGFDVVRAHLVVAAMLWSQLAIAYRSYYDAQEQRRFPPTSVSRLLTQGQRRRYRNCRAQRDRVLALYSFFVLLEARRQGQMPAWEGIRLVRDKIPL
ncbi:MAG: NACHT domain-containing protein [Cyanobacteria bacterium P01_A01_bin.135]